MSRTVRHALLALLLVGCGSSNAPRGFQEYQLDTPRQHIEKQMSSARQLVDAERVLYNFITDDLDGSAVSRWIDRRRVQSGDSVTVLATFDHDRLARVDVVYPPTVALDGRCPMCVALAERYGAATTHDTSSMGVTTRWTKWSCCELRLAQTPLTVVVSYVSKHSSGKRATEAHNNTADLGQKQLQ